MLGASDQLAFLKRAQMDGIAAPLCVASDHGPAVGFLELSAFARVSQAHEFEAK